MYTGECALGTGFLSSLGATFADFLGTKSDIYSEKLEQAKDFAFQKLYENVRKAGGNAIVGVDINYTTFSKDIMGVIATGTAVKVTRNDASGPVTDNSGNELPVTDTNIRSPFRPISVSFTPAGLGSGISVDITSTETSKISGILADVEVTTIFDEKFAFNELYFLNFIESSAWHYRSGLSECKIDSSVSERAKSVSMRTKKYINDDAVICVGVECMGLQESEPDFVSKEEVDTSGIMRAAEAFSTAREVMDFLEQNYQLPEPEMMSQLRGIADCERIYGNMHNEVISKLKEFLGQ